MGQMSIYTNALKILFGLRLQNKYPDQVDMTLDNLRTTSLMLLVECRREAVSTNVSKR